MGVIDDRHTYAFNSVSTVQTPWIRRNNSIIDPSGHAWIAGNAVHLEIFRGLIGTLHRVNNTVSITIININNIINYV